MKSLLLKNIRNFYWKSYSTNSHSMKCFKLNKYAPSISELAPEFTTKSIFDVKLKPNEALVKVHAASINPFDKLMTKGYGKNVINLFRNFKKSQEFPLITGRDCSGVIIKRGKQLRRFKIGDEIYGVKWIVGQGTHAQYVILNKDEMCLKPKNLNFIEAASLPYVACTTWSALVNTGAISIKGSHPLKVFIPGGAGGIGSFAIQLCKQLGHDVVSSASNDGIDIVKNLGCSNVLDYRSDSFISDLKFAGPFDVIFDTIDEAFIDLFKENLKMNINSKYISLKPSLLPDTDEQGVLNGLVQAGTKYVSSNAKQFSSGKGTYIWGFFTPNGLILENIKPLVENGSIKPLVDKVFSINDVWDAYKYVENGHARGKTVIDMIN